MSAVLPTNPAAPVARSQHALKSSVGYPGIGLDSGKHIKVCVRPAEAGTGVSFVRMTCGKRSDERMTRLCVAFRGSIR